MIQKEKFVFQTDSKTIKTVYESKDNYLVEIDEEKSKKYCAIYFSSNNIYYPNESNVFQKAIVENDRFEWYGTRIEKAHKHIFLRDIKKQWYLTGVNKEINSPGRFYDFLKEQTQGYNIITVGSSAGGFAAVLYGQLLNAETIYSFNGQFEINSLLQRSNEMIDPLVFRERENVILRPYYDSKSFIKTPKSIHYFCSRNSAWDNEQFTHINTLPINIYHFKTNHHGIPFIKSILPKVLNKPIEDLNPYLGKKLNPIFFSIKIGGFILTLSGLWKITKSFIVKKISK